MKETNWYYEGFFRLLGEKLSIKNYDILSKDELEIELTKKDDSIIPLFNKFKESYTLYSDYFESTYKDKPFTSNEIEKYNTLSNEMNSIRNELLSKVVKLNY